MGDDVKMCVDMRLNFYTQHYTVPPEARAEVEAVKREITALGAKCRSAAEFEKQFNATGLSARFNASLMKCTPKPYKMTGGEKAAAQQTFKADISARKGEIAKGVAKDVGEGAAMRFRSDLVTKARSELIKNDVLDDVTRASNAVEDTAAAGKFLGGIFKKKK